jgi:hypothetical protein
VTSDSLVVAVIRDSDSYRYVPSTRFAALGDFNQVEHLVICMSSELPNIQTCKCTGSEWLKLCHLPGYSKPSSHFSALLCTRLLCIFLHWQTLIGDLALG